MTNQQSSSLPGTDLFTRIWSDFAAQMMQSGMAFAPDRKPPEVSREMRSAMIKAWSDYCDQFMRSADFLEMMKQSLSASLQARKQMNDFLGQMQHEFQNSSRQDVDQMAASLQHVERRIIDRLEDLASQIDRLEQRLLRVESKATDAAKKPKKGRDKARDREA
jgi:hypothetical protein